MHTANILILRRGFKIAVLRLWIKLHTLHNTAKLCITLHITIVSGHPLLIQTHGMHLKEPGNFL